MATYEGHKLPSVEVKLGDHKEVSKALAVAPLEALVEVIAYCDYQLDRTQALSDLRYELVDILKARLASLPESQRGTRRVDAALMTYTEGKEAVTLIDRDATVASLTEEQLRASYKPDMKALEIMLKPDHFNRLVKRTPKPPVLTIRKTGKEVYHEVDGDDDA